MVKQNRLYLKTLVSLIVVTMLVVGTTGCSSPPHDTKYFKRLSNTHYEHGSHIAIPLNDEQVLLTASNNIGRYLFNYDLDKIKREDIYNVSKKSFEPVDIDAADRQKIIFNKIVNEQFDISSILTQIESWQSGKQMPPFYHLFFTDRKHFIAISKNQIELRNINKDEPTQILPFKKPFLSNRFLRLNDESFLIFGESFDETRADVNT